MGAFDRLGFNLRLSDIQAAVGRVAQMAKLDRLLAANAARSPIVTHCFWPTCRRLPFPSCPRVAATRINRT